MESSSEYQDFTPVIIRKKKTGSGSGSDSKKPVSAGAGAGAGIRNSAGAIIASLDVVPKHIKAGKKLSEHDDLLIPKQYLSSESRNELVQARTARKLTQVALNNALSLPANTINSIESGKLCPSAKQLDIINRFLGTKLHYAH